MRLFQLNHYGNNTPDGEYFSVLISLDLERFPLGQRMVFKFAILDLNGNLLSSIQIPGFYGAHGTQDMILHSNGDLIMGGIDNNASSGQWNNYLKIVRYDTNGNRIWERQYNEGYPDEGSVIKGIEDSDGNLIFMLRYDETGYTNDKHGIFKVDINDGTKLLP